MSPGAYVSYVTTPMMPIAPVSSAVQASLIDITFLTPFCSRNPFLTDGLWRVTKLANALDLQSCFRIATGFQYSTTTSSRL
jgi:hypothetical protein